MLNSKNRVLLCILDGWGNSKSNEFNAVFSANTPNYDNFIQNRPHTFIHADGLSVGLSEPQAVPQLDIFLSSSFHPKIILSTSK